MTPDAGRRELLSIGGVVGAALLIVTVTVYLSFVEINWTQLKEALDAIKNGATIAAILIGGFWTYYNFVKGKIYSPRIESHISGRVIKKDGVSYLIAIAQLKNVGTAQVYIAKGTAVIVYSYKPENAAPSEMNDAFIKRLGTPRVFLEHTWVAPGTTVEDQRLFVIPSDEQLAFRIQLRVVYNNKRADEESKNKESNTGAIVEYPPEPVAEELTIKMEGTVTYE
jgi:hypothetical protein